MQIYMTINRLSGKFYIGKNKSCDVNYLGSGLLINRAINKYGRENFYKVILEEVDNVELLNEREKYWIEHYRKTQSDLMYNIGCGGEWGDIFTNHPDKELIREKLSDSIKLKFQNTEYLKEHRKRLSNPEVRKNMSESKKLSHSNPEVRKKMSDSAKSKFENVEYLEEHRKRLSNTEVRKKMSAAAKARAFKSCSINGIVYNIVWDAVHVLGIKNREIRRRCKSEEYPTYFYID